MKRDLIHEIANETGYKEAGLRVTLSNMKKRLDLRSIEQAACYYIKKNNIDINVSSIIDDVTRDAVQQLKSKFPQPVSVPISVPARHRASRSNTPRHTKLTGLVLMDNSNKHRTNAVVAVLIQKG